MDTNASALPDPNPDAVTDGEIRATAELLDETTTLWDKVSNLTTQLMACTACGGQGTESLGVFGTTVCVACDGTRYVDVPGDLDALTAPPLADYRRRLVTIRGTWTTRQAWLADPAGAEPPIPARSDLRALEADIRGAASDGRRRAREAASPQLISSSHTSTHVLGPSRDDD